MTNPIDPRHLARLLALQIFFEADIANRHAGTLVADYANMTLPADDVRAVGYMAMQAVYNDDVLWSESPFPILEDFNLAPSTETYQLLRVLIDGVLSFQEVIDETIATYAPEWPLDQMAVIERNVLRIALFEVFYSDHIPTSVAISEAVRIVKLYGADNASSFVNGVLGKIADKYDTIQHQLNDIDAELDTEVDSDSDAEITAG